VWRVLRDRRYLHGLAERAGFLRPLYKRTVSGAIWLHAVSLGEVLSSAALIRRLRAEYPGSALFVSCGTNAGRQVAEEKLSDAVDGIFYLPFDYCFAVRRVLRHIRPASVIPSHANEQATMNGKLVDGTKTARFVNLVRDTDVFLPLSGTVMEFNGRGRCVVGCTTTRQRGDR